MSYSGYLIKIGDYKIPHKYIKADSYQAYVNMQDLEPWTDTNGYLHREKTVSLKALKVEFDTPAMLTNKQFEDDLIANFFIPSQVSKALDKVANQIDPVTKPNLTQFKIDFEQSL